VVAFAVSDDTPRIGRQYRDFQLSLPILSGKGLRQSYGVESTPKFLILDADGVVRGSYDGWGLETPAAVAGEVRLWLMKKAGSTLQKGSGLSPDR